MHTAPFDSYPLFLTSDPLGPSTCLPERLANGTDVPQCLGEEAHRT
jgi:hypothetical protein